MTGQSTSFPVKTHELLPGSFVNFSSAITTENSTNSTWTFGSRRTATYVPTAANGARGWVRPSPIQYSAPGPKRRYALPFHASGGPPNRTGARKRARPRRGSEGHSRKSVQRPAPIHGLSTNHKKCLVKIRICGSSPGMIHVYLIHSFFDLRLFLQP
jgi:hypothetical protein